MAVPALGCSVPVVEVPKRPFKARNENGNERGMTNRQFTWVTSAALVLLGFLAYANTFSGDWVWDDVSSVLLHENVQNPAKLVQLFREDQHAFGRGQGNFYRPLVSTSFMVDFLLSYNPTLDSAALKGYPDVKPFIFHLSNTLWHCAAAVLLFLLLGRLKAPPLVQAAAAVLFVLHPMHTEAVAYISGRADMMSATFILAALLCATTDAAGAKRLVGIAFSGLFFVLGLCSKESTMIYPLLLAIVIVLRPLPEGSAEERRVWLLRRAYPLGLAAVILCIYGVLRATVLKFGNGGGSNDTGLTARLVETCQAFAFYIKTLFLPTGLHMEQTLAGVPGWTALLGLVLLAACIGTAVWAYRAGQRRITLALVWFLAAWLPISGIFPLNAPMAEHWMYVPMIGFWWAVLELLVLLSQRVPFQVLPVAVVTVLGLLFLNQTVTRNRDWRDNESIFRATLAQNPDSLRVHSNLAVTYDFLQGNYPGAARHYTAVLNLYEKSKDRPEVLIPDEIPIRLSLAEMLLRQRKYSEAIQWYGSLMPLTQQESMKADGAKAAFGLGQCYLGLGNFADGTQLMQQALSLDPTLGASFRDMMRGVPLPGPR